MNPIPLNLYGLALIECVAKMPENDRRKDIVLGQAALQLLSDDRVTWAVLVHEFNRLVDLLLIREDDGIWHLTKRGQLALNNAEHMIRGIIHGNYCASKW